MDSSRTPFPRRNMWSSYSYRTEFIDESKNLAEFFDVLCGMVARFHPEISDIHHELNFHHRGVHFTLRLYFIQPQPGKIFFTADNFAMLPLKKRQELADARNKRESMGKYEIEIYAYDHAGNRLNSLQDPPAQTYDTHGDNYEEYPLDENYQALQDVIETLPRFQSWDE